MRALVTGGAGFIGSHLVERLVKEGHQVRVLDDLSSGRLDNLMNVYQEIEVIEGDVRDPSMANRAVQSIDIVFHKAARVSVPASIQDPMTYMDVNVLGTANILHASAKASVGRILFASSSAVYGNSPIQPIRESTPPAPLSPYALSKLVGEQLLSMYSKIYGIEVLSFRYFNVFGPRQDASSAYAAVIPKFVEAIVLGERPVIYGDGEQTREFVYVGDVVAANMMGAAAETLPVNVLNVSSGRPVSVRKVLDTVASVYGLNVPPVYQEVRPGDVRHSSADISLAADVLGFTPSVSLLSGIERTYQARIETA